MGKNNNIVKHEIDKIRGEVIIKGADSFIDYRGKIDNYYLNESINWIGLVIREKINEIGNVMGGNHYHPFQEQKVLVIYGSYITIYKDLTVANSPVKCQLVQNGDLVITPPNVAHTQIFLEDTALINLVNGEREHKNYGKHTISYELVKAEEIDSYVKKYKTEKGRIIFGLQKTCRVCESHNLKKIISFGNIPLANNLPSQEESHIEEEIFPLDLMFCENCYLCQLSYVVDPEKMFKHYLYLTSTTDTTKKHFFDMATKVIKYLNLDKKSLVVDVGSNDGNLLTYFKNSGIGVVGVEPAENISKIAINNGIDTLNCFFDDKAVNDIITKKGKADLITANNVFAHVGNIEEFTRNVKNLLNDTGVFIIEAQYLLNTIKDLTFDNIYHEHVSYFSVLSLNEFFKRQDMEIFKVEHLDIQGGSIRVFVQKNGGKYNKDSEVDRFLEIEKEFGLNNFLVYKKFAESINKKKEKTRELIISLKNNGKKIIGYGAPAKATTLLNFYNINNSYVDYIVEDNPLKQGRIVPGVKIPIKSKEFMNMSIPDYVYVFAWNYIDEILKNNLEYSKLGVKFIVPYPELEII